MTGVPGGYRGGTVEAGPGPRPGAGADPDERAVHGGETLAAYRSARQAEIPPDPPEAGGGKILRREPRSRTSE
ncbi:hypothetical protein GCM10018980_66660 [Streptomyces capoamus]|uniref:Uncharacterized protein n=1 Tax=Streptomyces capoamus TaxID=68183 RepID=A0A919F2Y3_9ACTN|nr:hypothetical protein GCM10010501_55120 [Streptomyces libani subsp. rufus]GHG71424.1 hypothetical protein GCM10018980_66660 [Streptomyces capoamus]